MQLQNFILMLEKAISDGLYEKEDEILIKTVNEEYFEVANSEDFRLTEKDLYEEEKEYARCVLLLTIPR